MGFTSYSVADRNLRSKTLGYETNSINQNFTQREVKSEMNPKGIAVREARDSDAHPNTVPIILGLDVTGSMGRIPQFLITKGLPKIMGRLMQHGIEDASLLFTAIGDHECDNSPLQVGQFESGDKELDNWLTSTYLEGGGGGNAGESYLLAWYFAAYHTKIDAFEKRNEKGFLITVGDEPNLPELPQSAIKAIMGDTAVGQEDFTAAELYKAASEKYHVYHINLEDGFAGTRDTTINPWKQMLGDNFISIKHHTDLAQTIVDTVLTNYHETVAYDVEEENKEQQNEDKIML